ncbi:MAG TPA: BrnA antitoxin family protein [Anaerolineales bacterium]|jgi:uncharacterized protein (DUF4415 family)|nr:BrnA antitoxin family protein [Anaerolineales bacterium]HQX15686.1 BrnA antitoxin family protein [Anaerolineales bacterium]
MKKEYDFSKGKRGAVVRAPKGKTRITIRIDDDVLEWFRGEVEAAGGGSYQSLINDALREHLRQQQLPLEELLRRVVREELKSVAA